MKARNWLDKIGKVLEPAARALGQQIVHGAAFTAGSIATRKVLETVFGKEETDNNKK